MILDYILSACAKPELLSGLIECALRLILSAEVRKQFIALAILIGFVAVTPIRSKRKARAVRPRVRKKVLVRARGRGCLSRREKLGRRSS
jgi:hypothetical protein